MSADVSALSSRPRRPAALAAMSMALDPEGYFESCRRRHGDPFVVRMPTVGEVLVTGHPQGAREIFSAAPETFEPLHHNPVEPLLGTHSLILLAGDRHRRERKLMTPPFHGERMRAYGEIIRERTLAEVARWRAGEEIVLQPAMRRVTLDVILRAVVGVEDDARSERFRRAIGGMLEAYVPPLLVLPALRRSLGRFSPWSRFVRARTAARALFAEEIAQRRRLGVEGKDDVLSLLMAARYEDGGALLEDELIDEVCTLIVAGHDTTSTALVWALFHVHRSEGVLESIRAELAPLGSDGAASAEDFGTLPYLGAVCSESLRMHPVVPIVPRRVVHPFSFRGRAMLPGQSVVLATTLLHTDPGVWPAPARFAPERFLTKKYTPFEYAPFGGGARRCIGAAFGAYQMRVVLGTILGATRFGIHDGRAPAPVLMNITMAPRGPLRLRVLTNAMARC